MTMIDLAFITMAVVMFLVACVVAPVLWKLWRKVQEAMALREMRKEAAHRKRCTIIVVPNKHMRGF